VVAEDDTAFSQEASESLVSKANLSGRGFEGPASSVGGFRSLKKVFGCPAVSAVVGVSGGVARAGVLWWEPLRRTFAAEIIDPLAPIKIIPATLGTTAPIIGAARGALALAGNNDNHRP